MTTPYLLDPLLAISSLDGRYALKTKVLAPFLSEFALFQARLEIEILWLIYLARSPEIPELPPFTPEQIAELHRLYTHFDLKEAHRIKHIERETHHDMKALEYYLRQKLSEKSEYKCYLSFIHFACTSEDINNLAYGLLMGRACQNVLIPELNTITATLRQHAKQYAHAAMLSRTHGQSASPTTMGKELANFFHRLNTEIQALMQCPLPGKLNGAVGNYNAHIISYPQVDWPRFAQTFVESLGLHFSPYTTQIEPHDGLARLFHHFSRIHSILLDLCRDLWGYIALGYFHQQHNPLEVGSSTMPHKINPIDFENAEGNLGLANALLNHFAQKLPISRWQRDLSDSTVLRSVGSALAYGSIAYQSIHQGLSKLQLNTQKLQTELSQHWEVLAEPIQTVMRRYGIADAYEQLKTLTRGKALDPTLLHELIEAQPLPKDVKITLKKLTPQNYTGLASELAVLFTDVDGPKTL